MDHVVFRPGGLALTKRCADMIGIHKNSRILDIGCGTGATLLFLNNEYGCGVCGIDLSPSAAAAASENVPEAEIRCENASSLSYRAERFDAVFMECTLTLFDEPRLAIKEAYRVLRPGGHLVISAITSPDFPDLIREGSVNPNALVSVLQTTGFTDVTYSDEKQTLTQLYCDIIFKYGTIDKYLRDAEEHLGGTVLNCNMKRKGISYGVFICRKPSE